MLYAPSHFWSCHFPAVASIWTIGLYALFGVPATLLVVPFLLFYPMIIYGTFRQSAVQVTVDNGRLFIRQGLKKETVHSLQNVTFFIVNRNRFLKIKQIPVFEWFLFRPKEPVQMIMHTEDLKETLLFSYLHASPLIGNWTKFAKELEANTGKSIHLVDKKDTPNKRFHNGPLVPRGL